MKISSGAETGFSWKCGPAKISRYTVYCLLVSKWSHSQTFSMVQEFSLGMRLVSRSKVMAIVTTLRSFFKLCIPFINGLPALHVRPTWTIDKPIWLCDYRIAGNFQGNFRGRKTFVNFAVLWLSAKVFSAKFGGVASFGAAQASNLRNFSPRKSYFSPIRESFLPRKFPTIQYIQGKAS